MKVLHYFRQLDYLSHEIKLTIHKNNTRLKTSVGAIITLLSILLSISFALVFFIQLIQKKNIFITSSSDSTPYINLQDSNEYPFLLRLTDKDNKPLNSPEKIYSVSLKYWYGGSNNTQQLVEQKNIDIQIEKCDISKHFGKYQYLFKDIRDLQTFYCPIIRPYHQNIFGRYGDMFPFGYYHFYLTLCINSDNCLPQTTVEKITENVYLDFRTVAHSIHSFKEKVKYESVRSDRLMISSTVYKRIWYYLNQIDYISDHGIFFNTEETESFSQYESMRYDTDHRDLYSGTIPGTFATMTILSSGQLFTFKRHFLKIEDYLASIGGIIKFIQIFAFILNYIYSYNSYHSFLINNLHIKDTLSKVYNLSQDKQNLNPKTNMNNIPFNVKNDVNESKVQITATAIPSPKNTILKKMEKTRYRMIPIFFFSKIHQRILFQCIAKVNSMINISNLVMKIEEHHHMLNELYTEENALKKLSCTNLNKKPRNIMIPKLHISKGAVVDESHYEHSFSKK